MEQWRRLFQQPKPKPAGVLSARRGLCALANCGTADAKPGANEENNILSCDFFRGAGNFVIFGEIRALGHARIVNFRIKFGKPKPVKFTMRFLGSFLHIPCRKCIRCRFGVCGNCRSCLRSSGRLFCICRKKCILSCHI